MARTQARATIPSATKQALWIAAAGWHSPIESIRLGGENANRPCSDLRRVSLE